MCCGYGIISGLILRTFFKFIDFIIVERRKREKWSLKVDWLEYLLFTLWSSIFPDFSKNFIVYHRKLYNFIIVKLFYTLKLLCCSYLRVIYLFSLFYHPKDFSRIRLKGFHWSENLMHRKTVVYPCSEIDPKAPMTMHCYHFSTLKLSYPSYYIALHCL